MCVCERERERENEGKGVMWVGRVGCNRERKKSKENVELGREELRGKFTES